MRRFWAKVDKTNDCWLWTGALFRSGYGNFTYTDKEVRRNVGAHRYAYFLTHGEWPAGLVLHHCDTPACVRPDHLYIGNYSDNMNDMWRRNRHARSVNVGSNNAKARLSEDAVREIRKRYSEGALQRELADDFGVGQQSISRLVNRVSWRSVD
jgi:hypothetical protein